MCGTGVNLGNEWVTRPPPPRPPRFNTQHLAVHSFRLFYSIWLTFQYLMKAELLWLPIVGWKAVLAKDIFVHRQTQSSFRRLLLSTTRSLKAGNSIMTFPGKARDFSTTAMRETS